MPQETPAPPGQFGLWGKEEKRDWPPITVEEARHVLRAFTLPEPITLTWHSARPFSAVARCADGLGQAYFLKRHHTAIRTPEALREEHGLIRHLSSRNMAVACPIRRPDGDSIIAIDSWTYECFPQLTGEDRYRDRMSWESYFSDADAYHSGRALALFHEATAQWHAPARTDRPLVSALTPLLHQKTPADALYSWIAAQPAVHTAMEINNWHDHTMTVLAPHFDRLAPLRGTLSPHWGHGDWHGSNLIWSTSAGANSGKNRSVNDNHDNMSAPRPLDFSMADRTTRCFDIAVALERSMIGWLKPEQDRFEIHHTQLDAFLEGYATITHLNAYDHAEIAAMLPLAHVTFACSEIWYYAILLRAPDSAKIAYEDYLLSHATWFSSRQGARLLERITRKNTKAL